MPMFKKILYATDFSPLARAAIEYVKGLKDAGAEEVVVVHVIDAKTTGFPQGVNLMEKKTELMFELPENEARQFRELIEMAYKVKEEIEEEGLKVKIYLTAAADFSDRIVEVAQDEEAKVIVLGAHGKSFIEELVVGSVSHGVIEKSKVPVLVVKKGE
ncbi:universal stress protein [Desulfurobacterium atlanticum]|uniref:Nucleotide-binding universal stress protein, UspA family n=1 Tax=Desulfurobacterium atlanticum TaxID=240169 RepID=A0A238YZH0_9BACT|nr:universal stress protein [Desulfurobacterium atlanticum]SNR76108.1 Nucleotide-binding universal stress protein, UspA family [Desulfurobacterium atlanticum]